MDGLILLLELCHDVLNVIHKTGEACTKGAMDFCKVRVVGSILTLSIMKKERKDWDTNRSMARRPKRTRYWCFGCDRFLVAPGQKCPVCGCRPIQKRLKKEN